VHTLSRQQVCSGALAALALLPSHGLAAEEPGNAALVTDRVALVFTEQLSAEERREYAMTLGLYGGKAPRAVERFKALATGTLSAPCEDQMEASEAEALARSALTKRSVYRQCLAAEAEPVSYGGCASAVLLRRVSWCAARLDSDPWPCRRLARLAHHRPPYRRRAGARGRACPRLAEGHAETALIPRLIPRHFLDTS